MYPITGFQRAGVLMNKGASKIMFTIAGGHKAYLGEPGGIISRSPALYLQAWLDYLEETCEL